MPPLRRWQSLLLRALGHCRPSGQALGWGADTGLLLCGSARPSASASVGPGPPCHIPLEAGKKRLIRGARCPLSVWVFLVPPHSLFAFLTHLTSSLLSGFFLQINPVSHSPSSKFVIVEGSPNDLHFLHLLSLAGLMTFSWFHCTVLLPLTVKGQKHIV